MASNTHKATQSDLSLDQATPKPTFVCLFVCVFVGGVQIIVLLHNPNVLELQGTQTLQIFVSSPWNSSLDAIFAPSISYYDPKKKGFAILFKLIMSVNLFLICSYILALYYHAISHNICTMYYYYLFQQSSKVTNLSDIFGPLVIQVEGIINKKQMLFFSGVQLAHQNTT